MQMYLQKKDRSELTALEKYLLRKFEAQSIDYFPISRSLAVNPNGEEDEETPQDTGSYEVRLTNIFFELSIR